VGSIASRFDLRNNAEWADERRNQFRIGDNYFYRVVKNGGTTFAAVPASLLLHIPEEIFWLCPSGSGLLNGTTTWRVSPHVSAQNGSPRSELQSLSEPRRRGDDGWLQDSPDSRSWMEETMNLGAFQSGDSLGSRRSNPDFPGESASRSRRADGSASWGHGF
jgi:hypothetical protein